MNFHLLYVALVAAALMPAPASAQDVWADKGNAPVSADTYVRRWGVSASVGALTQMECGDDVDSQENEGNVFDITAHWYPNRHFALSGGLYAEQTGILTPFDNNGIGKKKYWMCGLHVGARYYPLPHKWIVQPYLGASIYTNVLNLGHTRGSYEFTTNTYNGSRAHVDYDVQCPALSLAPQLGVELRLLSSVSFTCAFDYRWGIYGRSRADMRYVSGSEAGTAMHFENPMSRTVLSLGLKIDFPLRPVNWRRAGTTLLDLIMIWINGMP